MEDMYFSADLNGLVNCVSQYTTQPKDVFDIFNDLDSLFSTYKNKFSNNPDKEFDFVFEQATQLRAKITEVYFNKYSIDDPKKELFLRINMSIL